MDVLDAANHVLNFFAPAAAVALIVVLVSRFFKQNRPLTQVFTAQAAINFIVCAAVLATGLWFFGRDAKMATYLAMVVAGGTVQWVMMGWWRK
jgi:small basic protein